MRIQNERLKDVEWLRSEMAKKSMHLIASELGCTYTQVRYWTIKAGINPARVAGQRERPQRDPIVMSRILKQSYATRWPQGRKGKDAGHWKGGRRKHPSGYFIYCPDHPFVNKEKAIAEHRLVMEKKLGRYLEKKEIVHHINGNQYDNRPENLVLVNRSQHVTEYFAGLKKWEIAKKHLSRMKAILNAPLERLEIMAE